jgi:beta-barrel assembly-enhancing protease
MTTYSATYHTSTGRFYQATIFLSAVTITIRYIDEANQQHDVNWLTKEITGYNEDAMHAELHRQSEKLVIRDEPLKQAIKTTLKHHKLIGKPHTRLFGSVGAKLALAAGIIIALLLAAYLWLFPYLGERVAMNFSKETEINMGEQMYKSIAATYKIDAHKTTVINQFYKQLHYNVDYPVQITVVESAEMNAFAIPGGHIVVYDAILERMKTPEELAALLAHEGSHVALRHSLRNIFRSLARKMFLALLIGNDAGIMSVVIGNADELKGLQYSRSLETEADDNGLQLMVKNQLNPQGMLRLMHLLQKESQGPQTPEILNTHPVFTSRISNIEKQIEKLPPTQTVNPELKKVFHDLYE